MTQTIQLNKVAELVEAAFREGFNCGIGAGHNLANHRERDVDAQWLNSDAHSLLASNGDVVGGE